jgi:hypothetical protein
MAKGVALVAGANGVVGRGIVEQLVRVRDWEVIGLGRRSSTRPTRECWLAPRSGPPPSPPGRTSVNNGDCFRWEHLWPRLAEWFGLEVAPPIPIPLAAMMADKAPLWESITRAHGLVPIPLEGLVSWDFAEFVFRIGYDVISDATKLRRAGFFEMVETEAMFPRMFAELRAGRYIP